MKTRAFGYSMGGSEAAIEERINRVIERFGRLDYVEIGIGEGQTLLTVSQIAEESGRDWIVVGIDLMHGRHFQPHRFLNHLESAVVIANRPCKIYDKSISVWLSGSPYSVKFIPFPVGYALIDGCHCRECAIRDFLAIEEKVRVGGLVAFHDAGVSDQNEEPQCLPGRGIRVREALSQLGLLDGLRPGWRFDHEQPAERTTMWFERIA